MPRKGAALILVGTLLGAAGAAACGENGQAESLEKEPSVVTVELPAVSVVTVGTGDLTASLAISGSVSPRSRVAVIPKMSGTLQRVAVDIGDRVSPGSSSQCRIGESWTPRRIWPRRRLPSPAQGSNRPTRRSPTPSWNSIGRRTCSRKARSPSSGSTPPRRHCDPPRRPASLSAATLQQAEASLRRAKEVRRDATLTAPTAGVVVERNFDQGALVGPGDSKGGRRRG